MIALLLLAAAPALDCRNPMAQQDMNQCAWIDFQRADAALNAQWRRTVAAEREADKSVDRKYDSQPGYYETLLAAQRAWLTYRDNHCLGASFEARGGSLAPLLEATCKTALTEARTRELRALAGED
jgi:uncharacterized protein YecT (DUF1311 family)